MTNRITDILGIRYPIVQGPMSWLTNGEFVAAVSEAGGLGILGPNAGQTSVTRDPQETAERMRREIQKVKSLTDKPFGSTLIVDYDLTYTWPILQVVIEEKVPVVLINGILDDKIFGPLKENGVKIIYRPANPTIADAKAAEAFGVDIYVATGFDEGGSVPDKVIGTFSIVPMIADHISIPLMAAGGVGDVRGVRAALALGAEGVFVGSAFLTTEESPASPAVKDWIVKATAEDLLLFRTNPAYYRSLPTDLAKELVSMDQAGASRKDLAAKQNGGAGMFKGMVEGDFSQGYVSVGTGIAPLTSIRSVKELIEDFMQDFR